MHYWTTYALGLYDPDYIFWCLYDCSIPIIGEADGDSSISGMGIAK